VFAWGALFASCPVEVRNRFCGETTQRNADRVGKVLRVIFALRQHLHEERTVNEQLIEFVEIDVSRHGYESSLLFVHSHGWEAAGSLGVAFSRRWAWRATTTMATAPTMIGVVRSAMVDDRSEVVERR
jgi:hypothetical protein